MKKGRPPLKVHLSQYDINSLQAVIRKSKSPQRDVVRAKIVLLAHQGLGTGEIAKELGVSIPMVCKWRKRVAHKGCQGLVDEPRKGRPRVIGDGSRLELLALACEPIQEGGGGTPTLDDLVQRAVDQGIVTKISRSHLHRILMSGEVRPHRVKMWLHSKDPEFRAKTNRICELYRNQPEDAVVLCVDEKTGIQAIERKHKGRPGAPGRVQRQEYEYIRHGTQALLAAFNVHSGRILAECRDRRTQVDLLEFMEKVAKAYPQGEVHVIWDNLDTHQARQKVWQPFNERHGRRFHFHFTPLHASWVNQVGLWFGIYTRRVLRRASFKSTTQLRTASEAFAELWNRRGKAFAWTFRGYPLETEDPLRGEDEMGPKPS